MSQKSGNVCTLSSAIILNFKLEENIWILFDHFRTHCIITLNVNISELEGFLDTFKIKRWYKEELGDKVWEISVDMILTLCKTVRKETFLFRQIWYNYYSERCNLGRKARCTKWNKKSPGENAKMKKWNGGKTERSIVKSNITFA